MLTSEIQGHTIVTYNSIDEIPAGRYHTLNNQILVDSGVGNDLSAIQRRIATIASLIKKDPNSAITECKNLSDSFYLTIQDISPEMAAFSSLVYSIDGEVIGDLTDDKVAWIRNKTKNIHLGWFRDLLKRTRRLFRQEMFTHFGAGNGGNVKEYYQRLKTKLEFELKRIQGKVTEQDIKVIEEFENTKTVIHAVLGEGGTQVKDIQGFDKVCAVLTKYFNGSEAKNLSTKEFYTRLNLMKKAK